YDHRAAEKCDELAPSHRRTRGSERTIVTVRSRAPEGGDQCPLWVISRHVHVRLTPESGHVRCKQQCPLWPKADSCSAANRIVIRSLRRLGRAALAARQGRAPSPS